MYHGEKHKHESAKAHPRKAAAEASLGHRRLYYIQLVTTKMRVQLKTLSSRSKSTVLWLDGIVIAHVIHIAAWVVVTRKRSK